MPALQSVHITFQRRRLSGPRALPAWPERDGDGWPVSVPPGPRFLLQLQVLPLRQPVSCVPGRVCAAPVSPELRLSLPALRLPERPQHAARLYGAGPAWASRAPRPQPGLPPWLQRAQPEQLLLPGRVSAQRACAAQAWPAWALPPLFRQPEPTSTRACAPRGAWPVPSPGSRPVLAPQLPRPPSGLRQRTCSSPASSPSCGMSCQPGSSRCGTRIPCFGARNRAASSSSFCLHLWRIPIHDRALAVQSSHSARYGFRRISPRMPRHIRPAPGRRWAVYGHVCACMLALLQIVQVQHSPKAQETRRLLPFSAAFARICSTTETEHRALRAGPTGRNHQSPPGSAGVGQDFSVSAPHDPQPDHSPARRLAPAPA